MQIRQRRNGVTLIRTQYDPAIKRGRSVSLGSLSGNATSIPRELAERLRPAEHKQLEGFLLVRRAQLELEAQEVAALELEEQIRRATRWYERQRRTSELAANAARVRDEFSKLLAAMVRAGVGRKRQRTKSSP